ncbi:unnamed protein product, partial [Amoebophrya sp. A25]
KGRLSKDVSAGAATHVARAGASPARASGSSPSLRGAGKPSMKSSSEIDRVVAIASPSATTDRALDPPPTTPAVA